MHTLAFVDLDDTLFSSLRKQNSRQGLEPAAFLRGGEVISYSSPVQRGLLALLHAAGLVIPVTARNIDAFRRVLIPFHAGAIVSHGATILRPDGCVDTDWARRVAPAMSAARPALEGLQQILAASFNPGSTGLRTRLVDDGGDPIYLVAKHIASDEALVQHAAETTVAQWLQGRSGFTLHINGNNLAVIPPGIGKAPAVAYLMERAKERFETIFAIGAGDSRTDAHFLGLCDVALVPRGSQLAEAMVLSAQAG